MSKNKSNENLEIQRPEKDKNKITIGGSISISGNINSSAVIVGNNNTVTNIAGGDLAGDIYKTSQLYNSLNDLKSDAVKKYAADKEQEDFLREAIQEISDELKKGDHVDQGFINYLLRSIGRISPDILEIIVSLIMSQGDIKLEVKKVAKSTLSVK